MSEAIEYQTEPEAGEEQDFNVNNGSDEDQPSAPVDEEQGELADERCGLRSDRALCGACALLPPSASAHAPSVNPYSCAFLRCLAWKLGERSRGSG